jgi:hypothetical protein
LSRIHLKILLKKTIKAKYEEKILEKISNFDDSSKLFLHSKLKTDIKLEDYLKLTNCGKGVPCINIFISYIFIYIKCFLNNGVYSIRLNPGIVEHNLCFNK